MTLSSLCCSLENAKKLKELGVPQTGFFSWWITTDRDDTPALNKSSKHNCPVCGHPEAPYFAEVSAFTASELGEMLPHEVNGFAFRCDRAQCGTRFEWRIAYWEELTDGDEMRFEVFSSANEADARAKMLIYLLEQKLIPMMMK